MGWKRNKPAVTPMPKEPSLLVWLMGCLTAFIAGGLIFALYANQMLGSWQIQNIWILSSLPLFAWFIGVCFRAWRYNHSVDKHEFESEQAIYSQQQWTEWAGRYLGILYSEVFLPETLTVPSFIPHAEGLEHVNGLAKRVTLTSKKTPLFIQLNGVRNALLQLPIDLTLKVFFITDAITNAAKLQSEFTIFWQNIMPADRIVPEVQVLQSFSFAAVEERIKTPEISVTLILVQQLQGKDQYSDAMTTLLLATDDVASKYALRHPTRLLRPMLLTGEDLCQEFDGYFSTQTQAINTQHIIGDHAHWGRSFAALLEASEKHQGHWTTEQLHWLETYTGICGPFSPWIMTAVVSNVVQLLKMNCLMLSASEGQRFINTVTTGNENESS